MESSQETTAGGPPNSDLVEQVYRQLRAIAAKQMQQEQPGHTLQATALVNEAFLKLSESGVAWSGPAAFYHAAAEAMRRILIDHARTRGRAKRGGGRKRVSLNVVDLAADPDTDEILALDGHLCRLECEHPQAAAVVRLRFYGGLTVDRVAEVLGQSPRQVDRLWAFARAWLYRALRAEEGPPEREA